MNLSCSCCCELYSSTSLRYCTLKMGLVVLLCEPLPRRPIIAENAARVLRLRVNLLMPRRPLHFFFVLQLGSKRTVCGFRRQILPIFPVNRSTKYEIYHSNYVYAYNTFVFRSLNMPLNIPKLKLSQLITRTSFRHRALYPSKGVLFVFLVLSFSSTNLRLD